MKGITLVKLGGSLITDKSKPYTVRQNVLSRLAKEIKESGNRRIIVGHGGGSFPHQSASRYQTQKGIINKDSCRGISTVHNDAARLNRMVVQSFLDAGINAISVPPSATVLCKNSRIIKWDLDPVRKMLDRGLLPVPYGDVALDIKQGCCIISTEEILYFLAKNLGANRIILVGKVDGVMTADPTKEKSAELIKEITPRNFKNVRKCLTGSDGIDVTGGMIHKVERMLELAKIGIESEIINGEKPGNLMKALSGEKGLGTVIGI